MGHLAAAEADRDLDLVALLQKPAEVAQLDRVVADVGGRSELELLDLDLLRLLSGGVRFLLLLELELAEIHDAADRRVAVRLDLDEVEAGFLCHGQRFVAREDAYLLSLGADHAHPRNSDFVVPAVGFRFGGDTCYLQRGMTLPTARGSGPPAFGLQTLREVGDGHGTQVLACASTHGNGA